jgi:hypothetical protein
MEINNIVQKNELEKNKTSSNKKHFFYLFTDTLGNPLGVVEINRINKKFDIAIEDLDCNCISDEDCIKMFLKRLNANFSVSFIYNK